MEVPPDALSRDLQPEAALESRPNGPPPSAAAEVEALLGRQSRRFPAWLWIAGGGLALLVVVGFLAFQALRGPPPARYVTTPLRRGDLAVSVSATGTLVPVNQVDVGSELSGTVEKVLVDDNDLVTRGQLLAKLDTSRLLDQIANGEAALATARANRQQAQATLHEAGLKADRVHALSNMSAGGYPAKADIDAADAALERAQANVSSAEALIRQAAAMLNTSRTNLAKADIRSPIAGVVLSRKAEPGQTVAASLQSPVLFTLAEDMRHMELHVDVDEADVGHVRDGQQATFTVDAYPGRQYAARVQRIGLGSQTKEGVVTYTGVLAVDNRDLSLRPGMTASAEITSEWRHDVYLAPEAALQFQPPTTARSATLATALTPRMPRFGATPRKHSADRNVQQIWVLRDGKPVMIPVRVGASNGREAEISGQGLSSGQQVITAKAEVP